MPASKPTAQSYRWHGCWELDKRQAIARCRWFVAYEQLTADEFRGIVSGYSGGGAFEFENFFVRVRYGKILRCVIDDVDRVTGRPVAMSVLARRHRARFNRDLDFHAVFEEFNYGWDFDVQYLVPAAIGKFGLTANGGDKEFPDELDFVGGTASARWVKELLGDYFWITSTPGVLQPRISTAERAARRAKASAWIPKLNRKARQLLAKWERG